MNSVFIARLKNKRRQIAEEYGRADPAAAAVNPPVKAPSTPRSFTASRTPRARTFRNP